MASKIFFRDRTASLSGTGRARGEVRDRRGRLAVESYVLAAGELRFSSPDWSLWVAEFIYTM
ncbi:hypothetical protein GS528_01700 [Rhodococcus hoagii]|nr:hypothetical protein [Prescottella equi]